MDVRLGYRLLKDHRVPLRAKLAALGIGAACIAALEVLELPLEAVLAAILPLVGITGDIALGGAEAVFRPGADCDDLAAVYGRAAARAANPGGRGARRLGRVAGLTAFEGVGLGFG